MLLPGVYINNIFVGISEDQKGRATVQESNGRLPNASTGFERMSSHMGSVAD
jgi:hypothetical protein